MFFTKSAFSNKAEKVLIFEPLWSPKTVENPPHRSSVHGRVRPTEQILIIISLYELTNLQGGVGAPKGETKSQKITNPWELILGLFSMLFFRGHFEPLWSAKGSQNRPLNPPKIRFSDNVFFERVLNLILERFSVARSEPEQ